MKSSERAPLFDRPLRRDSLFWWSLVLVAMALTSTANQYPDGVPNDAMALAFVFDAIFNVVTYVGLFAAIPAALRRRRRARQAAKGSSS